MSNMLKKYLLPQAKYMEALKRLNSTAIGAKKPSTNLRLVSMDLSALLIAKTVFLLPYLW